MYSRFVKKIILTEKPRSLVVLQRANSTRKIDKLLIANRGEIACRIMKTAKKMGVKTVAVFSEADKNSLHTRMADEAYNIGPAPSSESYLRGDHIIEVAKKSKCAAIHPGYGFLSENAEFSEICERNNVIFVGPPASAIRNMGIKSTSKIIMSKAGVPVIKGYHGEDQTLETLKKQAEQIGFPIMIKAVRGGGGKGMRIALNPSDFEDALESSKSESQKSFGDSVVLLENFIEEPRHVEVQIFGDKYGNVVHLFERDCSVQRRHQKVIEEAPAPGISEDLRNALGQAAVQAAKAVGYVGAGTVEFILDRKTQKFHFMEMNTRLQVEHPITEMITNTDLVEWQLRVASGEKLPLKQEEITRKGHAFEARIYAENPRENFLPGAGKLEYLAPPNEERNVRIETGVRQGDEVSVFYDPMIAKLVVWGENRLEALDKMNMKLAEYHIAGLETNVNFLLKLTENEEFKKGNVHTNFIKENHEKLVPEKTKDLDKILGSVSIVLYERQEDSHYAENENDGFNPFIVNPNFRVNSSDVKKITMKNCDGEFPVKVKILDGNNFEVSLDDGNTWKELLAELEIENGRNILKTIINNHKTTCTTHKYNDKLSIFTEKGKIEFVIPKLDKLDEEDTMLSSDKASTPMPGIIDKIFVKQGDVVKKGDNLFVLIAMKMEHVVKASRDAEISNVFFKVGDNVTKDAVIVAFNEL